MKSKKTMRVLAVAAIGAVLGMVFAVSGSVSPEPSDHALDPTGGLIPLVLLPFCLPLYFLHGLLVSPILWWALPYTRFGRLGEWLEMLVTYPILQAAVYGALAWLGITLLERLGNRKETVQRIDEHEQTG